MRMIPRMGERRSYVGRPKRRQLSDPPKVAAKRDRPAVSVAKAGNRFVPAEKPMAITDHGGAETSRGAAAPRLAAGVAAERPLPASLLHRRCDPAELPFALCSELEEAPGLIGQDRAADAIQFAMRMRRKGYNVYALGASGTGRHGMIENLLRARAAKEPTPPDWCYVNNFTDPQQPHCLAVPAGRGAGLAAAMKKLVEELRAALPAAFERDEYRVRRG